MSDKIKQVLATIKAQAAALWVSSKGYIIAIGGIILAIEYTKIKDVLLVYAGKKEIVKDEKQDQVLATEEKVANDQANALVQKAKDEPSKETTVGDDWNKKK